MTLALTASSQQHDCNANCDSSTLQSSNTLMCQHLEVGVNEGLDHTEASRLQNFDLKSNHKIIRDERMCVMKVIPSVLRNFQATEQGLILEKQQTAGLRHHKWTDGKQKPA